MSPLARTALIWAPRLLGIGSSVFLALFALDAFDGRPLTLTVPAFALHLWPAGLVAAVVAVAWRHAWVGAATFAALAAAYAAMVPARPDWIMVIAGPLVVTAGLFAASAMFGRAAPHGHV